MIQLQCNRWNEMFWTLGIPCDNIPSFICLWAFPLFLLPWNVLSKHQWLHLFVKGLIPETLSIQNQIHFENNTIYGMLVYNMLNDSFTWSIEKEFFNAIHSPKAYLHCNVLFLLTATRKDFNQISLKGDLMSKLNILKYSRSRHD